MDNICIFIDSGFFTEGEIDVILRIHGRSFNIFLKNITQII